MNEWILKIIGMLSEKECVIWDDLDFLLGHSEIKNTSNNGMKMVMRAIESEKDEDLFQCLREILGNDFDNLDKSLENSNYENLRSLCAEVIRTAKKKCDGVKGDWDKPTDFFEGKTIYTRIR